MLNAILKHPTIFKTSIAEVQPIHRIAQRYFTHIFSVRTDKTFLARCKRLFGESASFLKADKPPRNLTQNRQMSQLDININVKNNVILYKYENDKHFRNLRIFTIGQLIGWSILAVYTYTPEFLDIFTTDITFKEYGIKHIFRLSFFSISIFSSIGMCLITHILSIRTVKYIILNKGGRTLSLVTYHLWKKDPAITVPVGTVKSSGRTEKIGLYVPIKVQEKSLFYLADKKGTFTNPKLFDFIMG